MKTAGPAIMESYTKGTMALFLLTVTIIIEEFYISSCTKGSESDR